MRGAQGKNDGAAVHDAVRSGRARAEWERVGAGVARAGGAGGRGGAPKHPHAGYLAAAAAPRKVSMLACALAGLARQLGPARQVSRPAARGVQPQNRSGADASTPWWLWASSQPGARGAVGGVEEAFYTSQCTVLRSRHTPAGSLAPQLHAPPQLSAASSSTICAASIPNASIPTARTVCEGSSITVHGCCGTLLVVLAGRHITRQPSRHDDVRAMCHDVRAMCHD